MSVALGLFQLGEPALWVDESFTWRAVTTYDYGRLTDELHWLYYSALKPWAAVAGTSEVALRLPSVAGTLLAVFLLHGLVRRMYGAAAAFIASLLFAFNPLVVGWSQQARGYSFLLALAIGSTWLLIRALDDEKSTSWGQYGFVIALMIVWQFFSAFLLLLVHLVVAWRSRRARVIWLLAVLGTLPWLITQLSRGESGSPVDWLERPTVEDVAHVVTQVPGALGVGLLLSILGIRLAGERQGLLVTWATLPFLVTLAFSIAKPVFLDRYLIISTPAFAVLAALGLIRLTGQYRLVALGVTAASTVSALLLWYAPSGGDNWKGENWRAATEFVMRDGGARVLPAWARPAFYYYDGRESLSGLVLERAEEADDFVDSPYVVRKFGAGLRVLRIAAP